MIYTNWDPLEEVIVGQSFNPGDLDWLLDHKSKDKFNRILEETCEDLDNLSKKLEGFGCTVYRPEPQVYSDHIKLSNFTIFNPTAPIVPRDQYFVYDSTIIQTYTSMPDRYLDSLNYTKIFRQLFDSGYNWISSPPPIIKDLNHKDEWWIVKDKNYLDQNDQLLWHTATLFKCGDTIIANTKGPGNQRGLEWVEKNLPAHIVSANSSRMNNFGHIDHGWFMTNDDLVFCVKRDWVPAALQNKEIVELSEFIDDENMKDFVNEYYLSDGKLSEAWIDRWLCQWQGYMQNVNFDTNVLVIDPKNVLFNTEQPRLFKFLETFGINCHTADQRHGAFWESGVHCLTLDVSRRGHKRQII